MWRWLILLVACSTKQPLQASYFSAKKAAEAPASCEQTLACYDKCEPLTEECMILCDNEAGTAAVDKARAVSYCSAQYACEDRECTEHRCSTQLYACTAPLVAPAPSPMRPPQAMTPQPMTPQPMTPPAAMQPRPITPPAAMQPRPMTPQPMTPQPMTPPAAMQPRPLTPQPMPPPPGPPPPPPPPY